MNPSERSLNIGLAVVIPLTIAIVIWNVHDLRAMRKDVTCEQQISTNCEPHDPITARSAETHFFCRTAVKGHAINVWLHPQF